MWPVFFCAAVGVMMQLLPVATAGSSEGFRRSVAGWHGHPAFCTFVIVAAFRHEHMVIRIDSIYAWALVGSVAQPILRYTRIASDFVDTAFLQCQLECTPYRHAARGQVWLRVIQLLVPLYDCIVCTPPVRPAPTSSVTFSISALAGDPRALQWLNLPP